MVSSPETENSLKSRDVLMLNLVHYDCIDKINSVFLKLFLVQTVISKVKSLNDRPGEAKEDFT